MPADPLLVVVLGPTASGKTALSLALAERFHGEVVNCDSVAMYREFEIGTAKPSAAERTRAPHHLLDVVDATGDITAGEYSRVARQVLVEIKARGNLPIVVGGTGLYLRALLDGLFPGPQRSEELRKRLRLRVEENGAGYLHRVLCRLDPDAAAKIHGNDIPKLIRAIEVCLGSRKTMTEMWKQGRDPLTGFRILRLGLNPDRDALYVRINQRAQHMFESGLVEETKQLLEKYGDAARPLNSLGYKQAVQLLRGELDRKSALQAAQQAHRNYAKRQMTWFRREPEVRWLEGFGDDSATQQSPLALVQEFSSASQKNRMERNKNFQRTEGAHRMTSKTTYVCLLRGINVVGHKIIKMDRLRAAFEALGFADVKTYIQSGNVVFKAPAQASEKLAKRIGEAVLSQFGFSVPVMVKTPEEVGTVIKNNPFLKEKGIDPSKLHVTFLSHVPEKAAVKMLDAIAAAPDRFRCSRETVYLHCPNGYGKTKLSNNAFEKVLSVRATTRNWNTVNRLHEMMRD